MGKKTKKTRWRTLTITDDPSDSEESSSTTAQRLPKGYYPKSYYNKFSYSSQSTPRRRYQYDGAKSTRSSSTASETKITFNEDEYTRITTPRQDVLFKKGYLNKPKNYQTQTSTGTSTTSTGNSTGNGTPDHQSTDLEYESQFVFPNGFVDQNGIYYVNGYESYPLMLYNPPTYYQEFSNLKSKRYSTDSLTESMSPNNEEATSQELSGGEASNNVSDYSGHHPVYNMIYPGYYVNEVCPPHDMMNGQCQTDLTRRIKKRRRRKTSKSQSTQDSSEYTEDESDSGDEDKPKNHPISTETLRNCHVTKEEITQVEEKPDTTLTKEDSNLETEETEANTQNGLEKETEVKAAVSIEQSNRATSVGQEEKIEEESDCLKKERSSLEVHRPTSDTVPDPESEEESKKPPSEAAKAPAASNLKPDAEEFIPRAYRSCDTPITSNVPFLKVPPNFVSIPVLPLGEFNGQNFNHAFIPPGIPINFLPPDPKMFPNFVGFIPNFVPKSESETEGQSTSAGNISNQTEKKETCDNSNTAKDDKVHQTKEPVVLQNVNNKTIDIATIVSKLEEAAKEQEHQDAKKSTTQHQETPNSPRKKFYENKYTKVGQRYKNYRRSYYNSPQSSPQKKNYYSHENINGLPKDTKEIDTTGSLSTEGPSEKKLEVHNVFSKKCDTSNGTSSATTEQVIPDVRNHQQTNSPERIKKNWKQHHYQNGSPKWQQNNATKDFRYKQNGKIYSENEFKEAKAKQNFKNYSTILTTKTQLPERKNLCESYQSQRQTNESSKKETKTEASNKVVVSPAQQTNQWISVSNRKKRKNKNADENDSYSDVQIEEEKEEHSSTDLFESYDVNLLVDVVPQKEDDVIKVETTENVIIAENIVETLSQNDTNSADNIIDDSLESKTDPLDLQSVEDPEQQDTVKIITEEPENISHDQINTPENKITGTEERELPEFIHIATQLETVDKSKKKTKKGTQKPQTKRVIITDLDLSMQKEEIKTPVKKVVTKLADTKITKQKTEEKPESERELTPEEKFVNCNEDEKKKGKKKKKKPNRMAMSTSSLSSSNTTINVMEDSYDFLLDSALSDETVEKTNIEISQELDKLIQRGMYSNLEEKIKLLNIDESDGFFKSIFSTISSREPSVEKATTLTQSPDLGKLLQNTRNLCAPSSVSQENNSQNKDINNVLPHLEPPPEDGHILETETRPHNHTVTKDAENTEAETEDARGHCETNEDAKPEAERKAYPITEAVKEWMNKTREKTPDVVLLKSPSAIYREFCDSVSDSDNEVTESRLCFSELNVACDDEITIFAKSESGYQERIAEQQDLLDHWQNDVDVCETTNEQSDNKSLIDKSSRNRCVDEGEDVVEVYESKYGRNEDYIRLQKEAKEKVNTNYPKHRNLPYRAICCNIM